MSRVCIVGAGYISNVHAEVLARLASTSLVAVVDPNLVAAQRLADRWRIRNVYGSVEEALACDGFERAHVLAPPDYHREAAMTLLRAGKAVLVEKPLSVSKSECDVLIETAVPPAFLGVNQNFVYHPAFAQLSKYAKGRHFGKPRFADILYNVPLRQMASGQFGHWMFRAPGNILLEQAAHPLSQLLMLCGPVKEMRALSGPPMKIAPGVDFIPSFSASFRCRDLPANMHFAVGQSFPAWQVRVVCDDGMLVADILGNRFWTTGRTRWLDGVDGFVSGQHTAIEIARDSAKNALDYGLSAAGFKGRSDGFFRSMSESVQAFHHAVDRGLPPPLDGVFGRDLVELCEQLCGQLLSRSRGQAQLAPATGKTSGPSEIAVLGGTGFIGRHVVSILAKAGRTVTVFARNTTNLPAEFQSEHINLRCGDIQDRKAVAAAINGASIVINLAHGGGGESWESIRDGMVGGAECVARASLTAGTKRLLHIGSVASLYLGPQRRAVTGLTPPDPHAEHRALYARAKALCDGLLMDMHARDKLPVCILRPALVVGEGSPLFHAGLGFCNNEQHCIGWNRGRNPLPFVLVEDVAAAIVAAMDAEGVVGRCFNLVGDVRLSAREYVLALAAILQRPLKYHPKHPSSLFLDELVKYGIKRLAGRRAPPPSWRDILSRGLRANFDCSDAKRDLGWCPVSDRDIFMQRAIAVHMQAS